MRRPPNTARTTAKCQWCGATISANLTGDRCPKADRLVSAMTEFMAKTATNMAAMGDAMDKASDSIRRFHLAWSEADS